MELLKNLASTGINILKDYGSNKELNSDNWGVFQGTTIKLAKSALNEANNIPIQLAQFLSTSCKYFPWPGLSIERTTIPGRFREQAYQIVKKYFEQKYGNYPVPDRYHWNSSEPLNIQWLTPENRTPLDSPPALYHIHGGGWMMLHSCVYNYIFRDLTQASSSQVMTIEYRLLPQVPVLSQVEDVFAGYFYLTAPISEGGVGKNSSQIVTGGESAGGHLSSVLIHLLRNLNIPGPAGAYLISPASDLTFSQPSIFTNTLRDYLWNQNALPRLDSTGQHFYSNLNNEVYGQSPRFAVDRMLKDGSMFGPKEVLLWPELSPLLDPNMDNLPPTFVVVGDRDSVRDTGILYGKLRAEAEIRSQNKSTIIPNIQTYNYDEMVHAFPSLPPNKYSRKAVNAMSEFIYQALNANDITALNSKKYEYLPDYKQAYMASTYNMYWNNINNRYLPWNSTYQILPFPTVANLTQPGISLSPSPSILNLK
jgi:acetyl esterase/lipase